MKRLLFAAIAGVTLAFTGCQMDDSNTVTRFNLRMTDAPGAYDALFLSIKEVKVISSEGEHTLKLDDEPFDILKFRLGKDTLLVSENIPAGRLQEVRLVLNDSGNSVIVDGESYPLTTPSGQSSGVKIKVNEDLTEGVYYTLKLDFDAARSVVTTGSGKYLLKPVIRAVPNAVSGAIVGSIAPASSSPKIYAIKGTDTLGTVSDSLGKFSFHGIAAGVYKVEINPVNPFLPKIISDVTVTTGSVKDLGTISLE
ncbi:MAG TPA: DUF4382 domain-containing protein [Sphingobacteriaceae bacterium]